MTKANKGRSDEEEAEETFAEVSMKATSEQIGEPNVSGFDAAPPQAADFADTERRTKDFSSIFARLKKSARKKSVSIL